MPIRDYFGRVILVAVDLRDDWKNVVAHGADVAEATGARLHLVHVLETAPPMVTRAFDSKALREFEKNRKDDAQERLQETVDKYEGKLRVETSLFKGNAAELVISQAKKVKATLIVVGATLAEGKERFLVGTTTDRILRHSSVPVLVVGPEPPGHFKRILVPTDLDRADQAAMRVASTIAMEMKGKVVAVHVCAIPSLLRGYMGDTARLRKGIVDHARAHFKDFVAETELPEGAKPVKSVLNRTTDVTEAAEAIVMDAERLDADLIVMALGGRRLFNWFVIGTTAEKIIRALPCSLLALPRSWARRR